MGEAKRRKKLDPNWGQAKAKEIQFFTEYCLKTGVKAGELFCFKLQKEALAFIEDLSLVSFSSEKMLVFVKYESRDFPQRIKLAFDQGGDDLYLVAIFLPDMKRVKTAKGKLMPLKMVVLGKGDPEEILAGAKAKLSTALEQCISLLNQ